MADNASVTVYTAFTQAWRLRNSGTCTWTSGCQLVFDHGDRMSAPEGAMHISGTVPPGAILDVSVTLKAPADAGTYQGFFKLRHPSGVLVGIGAEGNTPFWVKIKAETLLLLVPVPMIPTFPILSSSGTGIDLATNGCFNLHTGAAVACGSRGADSQYGYELLSQDGIVPRNSATFSARFDAEPSCSDCHDASLDNDTFDPTENRWHCTKTTDGKFGWIQVRDTERLSLKFDGTMW